MRFNPLLTIEEKAKMRLGYIKDRLPILKKKMKELEEEINQGKSLIQIEIDMLLRERREINEITENEKRRAKK